MWLNRSAILFQLSYKQKTNADFFILRIPSILKNFLFKSNWLGVTEYAKSNPEAVTAFVKKNTLKPLSTKEALKNIC
jgi:3-methyladenine DNA glycosylase AlkD